MWTHHPSTHDQAEAQRVRTLPHPGTHARLGNLHRASSRAQSLRCGRCEEVLIRRRNTERRSSGSAVRSRDKQRGWTIQRTYPMTFGGRERTFTMTDGKCWNRRLATSRGGLRSTLRKPGGMEQRSAMRPSNGWTGCTRSSNGSLTRDLQDACSIQTVTRARSSVECGVVCGRWRSVRNAAMVRSAV